MSGFDDLDKILNVAENAVIERENLQRLNHVRVMTNWIPIINMQEKITIM